jgi:hypothetical protein
LLGVGHVFGRRKVMARQAGSAGRLLRERYAFAFKGMWLVTSSRKSSFRLA